MKSVNYNPIIWWFPIILTSFSHLLRDITAGFFHPNTNFFATKRHRQDRQALSIGLALLRREHKAKTRILG